VAPFKVEAIDGKKPFIGYVEMTNEGEIVTPLTKIHDGSATWYLRQCYNNI